MWAIIKEIWHSIAAPPYRNLPWLIFLYVVISAAVIYQNGVFTGHVVGFDDQVRMTQVLDWVNGAGWYDRTITRVNAPEGFTTIWSRIVDIPLAAIVVVAQQFVPQKTAALVAVTIMPLVELAILFVAAPYFARPLLGKNKARLIVLFLMFSSILNFKGFSISGFLIGEASHHPWYVILDLLMFGAVARLVMGSSRRAPLVMLGGSIALLTAVGIEGYPMIAGAAALLALTAFGFNRPAIARRGANGFLCGAVGSLVLLPMHQPPAHFFHISFVDPSILGVILVASAWVFLKAEAVIVPRWGKNQLLAASILVAIAVLIGAGLITAFPDLLHGGAAGLSPAERKMALQGHPEGMPLHTTAHGIVDCIGLIMPIYIALMAGLFAVLNTQGRRRAVSFCYLGFVIISGGMSELYSRYYHHAMTTSSAWLVWVWERFKHSLPKNENYNLAALLGFVALGPFWMLLLPAALNDVPFTSEVLFYSSIKPSLCDPLALADYLNTHYDKNTTISVPWQSAEFLYYTNLRVDFLANYPSQDKFIDNYHFFGTRDPEIAREIAARHGFDLVAVCRKPILYMGGMPDKLQTFVSLLQVDHAPVWLKRVEMPGVATNYLLYEVNKTAVKK